MEINEQQLKKIQELTKQVCDLEEENSALAQEHLVMVKKQQQPNSDEKEQSTMADSKGNLATEESAEVIANKDKQIELLSNMLEQKANQHRKAKEDHEESIKTIQKKETALQNSTIDNQKLKVKVDQLEKLINNDSNAKAAYNAELLMDQNKQLKARIEQMRKQSQLQDQEITHLQGRQADYEKRMVLIQQQSRDNHLLQKMHEQGGSGSAHLQSLLMPFSSCAAVNRSGYTTGNGFAPQGFGANFYNQGRVRKPLRGGGGGKAALDRSSQGMNFTEFMEKNQS